MNFGPSKFQIPRTDTSILRHRYIQEGSARVECVRKSWQYIWSTVNECTKQPVEIQIPARWNLISSRAHRLCYRPAVFSRISRMLLLHFFHFKRIPVVTKSAYYIHASLSVSVCPSVRRAATTYRFPRIFFFIKNVYENCRQNPHLVKIGQKYRALYMKT